MDEKGKYDIGEEGRQCGYDKKGGWDIDTSEKTQCTSVFGHIPGRYQWEETIDVSKEDIEKMTIENSSSVCSFL